MLFGLPGYILVPLLKYNVALWIWRSDPVPQFLDLENYREIVCLKVKLFKDIVGAPWSGGLIRHVSLTAPRVDGSHPRLSLSFIRFLEERSLQEET